MPMPPHLASALRDWEDRLGPDAVVRGDGLTAYTANVTAFARDIPAALRIADRDQLLDVVDVARHHGVPLYPISTGRNWGLGSRLPVRDGAVVVDLAGMNRILGLDRRTRTVVVEPGVTQGQLAAYLDREAPDLLANMTGSAADTSLIGNTVDRGIGYLAQRTDDLVGLEVLLGTGKTLRTGEWHTRGDRYGPHWHHGIGPSLEPLFVQSNLAIVTAAVLRLRHRPETTSAFRVSVAHDGDVVDLLDALAVLRRDQVLTMPTRIFDGVWTHGSLDGPEPAWTAFGGISGRAGVVAALTQELRAGLEPLGPLDLVSTADARTAPPSTSESSWWRSVLSVMDGRPTDLSVTNWAARVGVGFAADDLDASDFGMLCDVRAIAFAGASARDTVALARETCAAHGLLPCISLSALDEHSLEAVFIVLFNRGVPDEVAAAHAAAADLRKALTAADLVPHRVGVEDMDTHVTSHDPFWETVAAIKRSLDPAGIVAPGRYCLL